MSERKLVSMAEAARQCHTTIRVVREALTGKGVRLVELNKRVLVYQDDLNTFKKEAGYID